MAPVENAPKKAQAPVAVDTDVDAQAAAGRTPLMWAIEAANLAEVQRLLAADVNAKAKDGTTALKRASKPEIRQSLIESGAKE